MTMNFDRPRDGRDLPAVLAIDAGNTKTDAALVNSDGTLLASARGPGLRPPIDSESSLRALSKLVERVRQQAGRDGPPVARHVSACMANLDFEEEEERLALELAARGWGVTVKAVNDTFAVLRAGLDLSAEQAAAGETRNASARPWGVAVVCGTGINCVGVHPSGRLFRFLALGDISGDWGGGGFLGRAALWSAIRAEDGRGADTSLRDAVAARFGVACVHDLAIALYRGEVESSRLSQLAPLVLAAAGTDDLVARKLVVRLAREVATMALVAIRRLDLALCDTPVILGGGVLTSNDALLIGRIRTQIAAEIPRAQVSIVTVPPVAGAALLGLDYIGAAPQAERPLRAAYGKTRQAAVDG